MTDYNRVDSSNLDALTATSGTRVNAAGGKNDTVGAQPAAFGVVLASGTTYYFPLGAPKSPVGAETALASVQVRGDAAIIATFTFEDCNFPATTSPGDSRGTVDVSDFDVTAGNWNPENPSTAIITTSGPGWTPTALSVASAGTNIGGFVAHIGNNGTRRQRMKVVVGGTGGKIRVAVHGKAGS